MRKFKSFIAVMAAMLLTVNTVGAATLDKLSVVQNTKDGKAVAEITVSGTSAGEYVSLAVINPGKSEADLANGASAKDVYHLLKNVSVVDGKYEYKWTVIGKEGEYSLKVEGAGDAKTLSLMSKSEIDALLAAVAGETSKTDTVKLFEDLATELAIEDLAGYAKNDDLLGAAIIADKPFADAAAAAESYKKNAVALIVANPENAEDAVELVDLYADELGVEALASYPDYAAMDESEKKEVVAHVAASDVSDADDFNKVFAQQIILTSIDNATSYGEVEAFFDDKYDGIFDEDLDELLKGVKSKSEIYKDLKGNYYEDEKTFVEAVEKLVKAQKKSEGGSSGGSGGGGGSSFGVTTGADSRVPSSNITTAENTVIFTDLADAAWAKNAIYALADEGILSGVGNGEFAPNAVVTREQFVQGIVKAFGFVGGSDPGFSDVNSDDWFYHSVCIAYENGIVSGVDAENFGVGKTLSREEMAALVYRAMTKKNVSFGAATATFTDMNTVSAWAVDAANAMFAEGIISGLPTGEFAPKGECTRAQMAVVLEKAMGKI